MRGKHLAGVLATVGRNGALARIELGFLVSTIVEWAAWLALVVIAFERGGAAEAGLIGFAVGLPAIVVAPTAAILGDRWPRSRVMLATYLAQALALLATAAAFVAGSAVLGYALGIVAMALVGLVRPLLGSLLPEVSRSPEDLTAANVASGLCEGAGALIGALGAGVLFGIAGASSVLALGAAAMVLAAGLVLPVAVRARVIELDDFRPRGASLSTAAGAIAREMAAGAATILADRRLAVLNGLMAVTIGTLGALSVLIVVVAIDVLGLDENAAGYLTAAGGFGALLGSAFASSLVGRERLAAPLLVSVLGFAAAVAAVGLLSSPIPVVLALTATGIGWSIAYIAATTLTQRLAGDNVMTRVFGVSESDRWRRGGRAACWSRSAGCWWRLPRSPPRRSFAPTGSIRSSCATWRTSARFRCSRRCPGPVLERLASGAEHVAVPAAIDVIRQGDPGDRFYIIVAGRVPRHGERPRRRGVGTGRIIRRDRAPAQRASNRLDPDGRADRAPRDPPRAVPRSADGPAAKPCDGRRPSRGTAGGGPCSSRRRLRVSSPPSAASDAPARPSTPRPSGPATATRCGPSSRAWRGRSPGAGREWPGSRGSAAL